MAGKLNITLVRSMICRPEKHRKVLRGMGLTRIGKTVVREDTPAIRGMIQAVAHMVRVEERFDEAQ
jgi:large subunit ribosomal protein L30